MAVRLPRQTQRANWPVKERLDQMENDIDALEMVLEKIQTDQRFVRNTVIGVLATTSGGLILLAVNIMLHAIKV